MLWIKGAPGTGKTIIMCGIINEIEPSTRLGDQKTIPLISYFFCQTTDVRLNSAVAVLRGLIYLLIEQQPSLIWHVQNKYDNVGRALFEGPSALYALSEIFTKILEDLNLETIYLSIDALGECTDGLQYLLDLIVRLSLAFSHVKWIISSRDNNDIKRYLSLDFERMLTLLTASC